MSVKLLAALAAFLTLIFARVADAQTRVRADHVTFDVALDVIPQPDTTVWVAIRQTIEPSWHTYWRNPGDTGLATSIAWTLPKGITAGEPQWPVPERFTTGPIVNFGYRNNVTTLVPLHVAPDARVGGMAEVKLFVLECQEMCIPENVTLQVKLSDAPGPSEEFTAARATMPKPFSGAAALSVSARSVVLSLSDPSFAHADPARVHFFPATTGAVDYDARSEVRIDGNTLTWTAARAPRARPLNALQGVLNVSGAGAYEIRATPVAGAMNPAAADLTLIEAALMAFMGGLILNLMPCVFPILSMKALSLSQSGESAQALRRDGVFYFAGVLLTCTSIAGILIVLKAAGAALGWGFQLQSPLVVFALALLMAAIGLNLLGVFEMPLSFAGVGDRFTRAGGGQGAFFTGVLAVLVASPCTAPFMGTAIGYALTQSSIYATVVFLALGTGFALPFTALAFAPRIVHLIPRPGIWMIRFREFLAFPMFATAIWLSWVLSEQVGTTGLAIALSTGLGLVFLFWLLPLLPVWPRRAAGVAGSMVLVAAGLQISSAALPAQWQTWSPQAVADAQRDGRAVLVDFSAAWCVTCLVNERFALENSDVVADYQKRGIVLLKADWTNRNSAISNELDRYGRSGVPLYLFYPAHRKGPATVLPQILTPGIVLGALNGAQLAQRDR
jgi:thiol:disulfide interchange protein